jgi:hypothetical protein
VTEGTKTGAMAVVAGVVTLLALLTASRPSTIAPTSGSVGKPLFEKFTDPLAATSLKILRYDSPKEEYVDFELSKDRKGVWTIPSHEGYPADADKQMSEAANLFVGMKAIDIASQKRSDQELFGVVEPNKQNSDKGGEGVGMLVQMRDSKGDMLADLIIGKETNQKLRFVRVPSEDVIYVAEIETAPLSTEFKSWIESDLLKLSSNDVEAVGIRDYQIVPVNQSLALQKTYEADLRFVTSNGQWAAERITNFDTDPPVERKLTDEEQLNAQKLNDLKSAVDNLRIADVAKKPAGLAGDLKGDKSLLSNQESLMSLSRRGFFPNPVQKDGDSVDFYSKSGEWIITLKDGVQYLLRFGNGTAEISASEDQEKSGEEAKEKVSINRYLLVTTRVDDSKFPQPELEKLPETVEELKALEALKNQPAPEAPVITPTIPSQVMPEKTEPGNSDSDPKQEDAPKSDTPKDEPKQESAAGTDKPSPVASTTRSRQGKLVAFQDPAPAVASTNTDKAAAPQASQEPTEQEWKERLEAEREKITKQNQRKIDQRNEKLQAAKKKVAELNGRFADWYYVVGEDDFKKMKISLSDLIQPKSSSGASSSPTPNFGSGGFPGLPPGR